MEKSIVKEQTGSPVNPNNKVVSIYKHNTNSMDMEPIQNNSIDLDISQKSSIDMEVLNKSSIDIDVIQKNSIDLESTQKNSLDLESMQKNSMELESITRGSIDLESMQKNSIDLEYSNKSSLDLESLVKNSIDLEIVNKNSIDLDALSKNSLDLESINKNSIELEVFSRNSIDLENANKNSIELESLTKNSIDLESISKNSIELDALNKSSIDMESLNKNSIDLETTIKNSIELDALTKNSIELESLNKNSIDLEGNSKNSLDLELLNKNSIDMETTNKNSIDLDALGKNSLDLESLSKNSIDLESLFKNSLDLEVVQKNSIELDALIKNSIELESITKNSIDLEVTSKNSIDLDIMSKNSIDLDIMSKNSMDLGSVNINSIDIGEQRNSIDLSTKTLLIPTSTEGIGYEELVNRKDTSILRNINCRFEGDYAYPNKTLAIRDIEEAVTVYGVSDSTDHYIYTVVYYISSTFDDYVDKSLSDIKQFWFNITPSDASYVYIIESLTRIENRKHINSSTNFLISITFITDSNISKGAGCTAALLSGGHPLSGIEFNDGTQTLPYSTNPPSRWVADWALYNGNGEGIDQYLTNSYDGAPSFLPMCTLTGWSDFGTSFYDQLNHTKVTVSVGANSNGQAYIKFNNIFSSSSVNTIATNYTLESSICIAYCPFQGLAYLLYSHSTGNTIVTASAIKFTLNTYIDVYVLFRTNSFFSFGIQAFGNIKIATKWYAAGTDATLIIKELNIISFSLNKVTIVVRYIISSVEHTVYLYWQLVSDTSSVYFCHNNDPGDQIFFAIYNENSTIVNIQNSDEMLYIEMNKYKSSGRNLSLCSYDEYIYNNIYNTTVTLANAWGGYIPADSVMDKCFGVLDNKYVIGAMSIWTSFPSNSRLLTYTEFSFGVTDRDVNTKRCQSNIIFMPLAIDPATKEYAGTLPELFRDTYEIQFNKVPVFSSKFSIVDKDHCVLSKGCLVKSSGFKLIASNNLIEMGINDVFYDNGITVLVNNKNSSTIYIYQNGAYTPVSVIFDRVISYPLKIGSRIFVVATTGIFLVSEKVEKVINTESLTFYGTIYRSNNVVDIIYSGRTISISNTGDISTSDNGFIATSAVTNIVQNNIDIVTGNEHAIVEENASTNNFKDVKFFFSDMKLGNDPIDYSVSAITFRYRNSEPCHCRVCILSDDTDYAEIYNDASVSAGKDASLIVVELAIALAMIPYTVYFASTKIDNLYIEFYKHTDPQGVIYTFPLKLDKEFKLHTSLMEKIV